MKYAILAILTVSLLLFACSRGDISTPTGDDPSNTAGGTTSVLTAIDDTGTATADVDETASQVDTAVADSETALDNW